MELNKRTIKVLEYKIDSKRGGIETFLVSVICPIESDNIHIDYLMSGNNTDLEKQITGKIWKMPSNPVKRLKYLICLVKDGNYDIYHFHKNSAANIIFPVLIKILQPKSIIIIHSHSTNPTINKMPVRLLHLYNKHIINLLSDRKLACSDLAAKWMFPSEAYENGEITIIKNGIPIEKYLFNPETRNKIRSLLNIDNKTILLGNVGRLEPVKNQAFLLQILKELHNRGYSVKLIICGEGSERGHLVNFAHDLQIEDFVLLPGIVSNINEILQAMDIFIMPSIYEGLPFSSIEAQYAGLPCLLSDRITKEVKLSSKCVMLSLDSSIGTWCNQIIRLTKIPRMEIDESVRNYGYDNTEAIQDIKKIYIEMASSTRIK